MPIYAITAALSVRYMQEAVYFDAAREFYEAFAVWSFMSLMIEYLNNQASRRYRNAGMPPRPMQNF